MESEQLSALVEQAILSWWTKLVRRIGSIKESGRTPVLVALSRKMPRLLEWIRKSYIPSLPDDRKLPDPELVYSCEITTELSIPFRASEENIFAKESYILVDDIIIHGSSLHSIATELELLAKTTAGGRLDCYLSTIFLSKLTYSFPLSVNINDIYELEPLDIKQTKEVVAELTKKIRTSNLPIDLEFPILRVVADIAAAESEDLVDEVSEAFRGVNPAMTYKGKWGNTASLIFDNKFINSLQDFAKIRFFKSCEGYCFEVFAPSILPNFIMENQRMQIFSADDYNRVWKAVMQPMFEFIKENSKMFLEAQGANLFENMGRSAAVFANYLLSLSFYTARCSEIIPEEIRRNLSVGVQDLILILGKHYAEEIVDEVGKIIGSNTSSEILLKQYDSVLASFAPEDFRGQYDLLKAESAAQADDFSEVLVKIFNFQNFTNPLYSEPQYAATRQYYGETYTSLLKACGPYYEDLYVKVNRWIDDQIDNGAVIPKYELFISSDGPMLWRRFFHAGLNAVDEV